MPTSEINNVPPILIAAMNLQPKRVLELGAGSGKYGVLLREYLDIGQGRLLPSQRTTTIDAVEGFEVYVNDLHRAVYDKVTIEDFSIPSNYLQYTGYDLVLMVDSLEHVEKARGVELLAFLIEHNRTVIVSCPFGIHYLEQGAVYGNEMECHRAHWRPTEFASMGGRELYRGVCAVYQFGM